MDGKQAIREYRAHLYYIFLTAYALLQVFLILFNGSTYGGADNINHFQIARYGFHHPELFLDLWGKPVFTVLMAPFSLFGYKTAQAFNVVVAVVTLILTEKLSRRIYPKGSIIIVLLTAFAPLFFLLVATCLTELLFALLLVGALYLFTKERFLFSAVVLSFIPFVRSEGYILFPLFALAYILKRNYLPVLLLPVGTLFYTLAGWIVFGDPLWLIHRFPYPMGGGVYGNGELFHFAENSYLIFGWPLLILMVSGLLYWIYQLLRKFSLRDDNLILFILIAGSWVLYFAAHSYVWWKGTGGSLGLIRVIGGVIPLAALTGAKSIEFIWEQLKNKKVASGLLLALGLLQVYLLFDRNPLPLKKEPIGKLVEQSSDFVRTSGYSGRIFYFNPEFIFHLGIDPYNPALCNWWMGDKIQPSNVMNFGDIVIWDAHFGPNEGAMPLETLQKDPYLKMIKSFYLEKITVLGGYDYSIHVFKKVTSRDDSTIVSETVEKILRFENDSGEHVVVADGERVFEMGESQDFGPTMVFTPQDFVRYEFLDFEIITRFKGLEPITEDQVLMVFSIEEKDTKLRYEVKSLVSADSLWNDLQWKITVPANLPASSSIGVYLWNKDRKKFLVREIAVRVRSY